MNRGTMRDTFLRPILQEDVADNWSDAQLNDLLNEGAKRWQDGLLAIRKELILEWYYCDIVAGERYYPMVAGTRYELELGYKGPGSDAYTPMELTDYQALRRGVRQGGGGRNSDIDASPGPGTVRNEYAIAGSWYYLSWLPDASISDALEVCVIPEISMSADTDSPDMPLFLHYGIVIETAIMALMQTPEAVERWQVEREREIQKLPHTMTRSVAGPEMLYPDVRKGY